MINIVHISTFHREGGAAIAALRLNEALRQSGANSCMLVHRANFTEEGVCPVAESPWQKKLSWLPFIGERLYFLPHEKDPSERYAFSPAQYGEALSQHPLIERADVIHLHWFNFGLLGLNGLEKLLSLGKPIVWTLHDMWALTGGCHYSRGCSLFQTHCQECPYLAKPGPYDLSFEQFEKKRSIYPKGKLSFIAPSQWLTELASQAPLGIGMATHRIPNCIDTSVFSPNNKVEAKMALGLPSDQKLLLFSGANTSDPRKGFVYLQEALQLNPDPDIAVLIFGKGDPTLFQKMGVKVHYLGQITEVSTMVQAYNAADLIVVPSLEDNLPNTIMEAMACGTPAVGFNTGGIADLIDHQQNGFVAEYKSATSLAAGIRAVLKAPQMGSLAREKVMREYTQEVIARKHLDLYQSLL
ncbi:glycosyltransferase involved in cell wall biosynthesis [Dyadobacter jejuensis]|uniref:Glycosyltransferase involved in cell wall biosynthesis n=1 Tax=Dyadobacter jejuensis TaxID=1082580 RepID=A0A316AV97_9BACT|nr:glycosyltransferase family 4 protein [Dyadobacter jejuensis]PWJ60620.1 glycosyltransferase involved in cell wall biosynthesis [Dyadobacter jejuensis]